MVVKRCWRQNALVLIALSLWITACGTSIEHASSVLTSPSGNPTGTTDNAETKSLSNWSQYPALSLVSEWQTFRSDALQLGLSVRWPGLGAEVESLSYVRMITVGSVDIVKQITSPDSRILKNIQGEIDSSAEEPASARCQYRSEAALRLEGSATIFMGGIEVEHEQGEVKILEVESTGKTFDVADGTALGDLETFCRQIFEREMRPIVERDLTTGIKSKLRMKKLSDPRLNALEQVLNHEEATIIHKGQRWVAEPLTIESQADALIVRGRLSRSGGWSPQTYTFAYTFRNSTKEIEQMEISPRGVDDDSRTALELSLHLARNGATWNEAKAQGRPYVIDSSALSL